MFWSLLGTVRGYAPIAGLVYSVLHSLDSSTLAFYKVLYAFVARLKAHAGQLKIHAYQLKIHAYQLARLTNHSLQLCERLLIEALCWPPNYGQSRGCSRGWCTPHPDLRILRAGTICACPTFSKIACL